MVFDIVCAVIFTLCVLIGYMKGIVRAVFLVACVAAAYYGSRPLGEPLGLYIHRWTGLKPDIVLIVGQVAAALGIYVACSIVTGFLARHIGRDERGFMKAWNRQLGALTGLVCGTALIFAGVCVADALVKSMPERKTRLFSSLRSSRLRRHVSDINPLDKNKDDKDKLVPKMQQSGQSLLDWLEYEQSQENGGSHLHTYPVQ